MLTKYSTLAAIVISLIIISNQATNVLAQSSIVEPHSITLSSSSLPTAGQVQNVPSPAVTNNSNLPHLKNAFLMITVICFG
jgi:hypothetical protein